MDSSKLAVKFFFKDPAAIHSEAFVPVFHRWIREHALPGHHLIDVADYKHVVDGPGTALISHEANLSIDSAEHQPGLLYFRKQAIEGDLPTRIRAVLQSTLLACRMIEDDPAFAGKAVFRTDAPIFRIHDRLHAPNTPETFAAVKPALESILNVTYGKPVQLTHDANSDTLFTVHIQSTASTSVAELLKKVS